MEAHFHLAPYLMLSDTSAGKPVYKVDPEIRTGGYVRIPLIDTRSCRCGRGVRDVEGTEEAQRPRLTKRRYNAMRRWGKGLLK